MLGVCTPRAGAQHEGQEPGGEGDLGSVHTPSFAPASLHICFLRRPGLWLPGLRGQMCRPAPWQPQLLSLDPVVPLRTDSRRPGESLIGSEWFAPVQSQWPGRRGQVPTWPRALLHGPSIPWPHAEHGPAAGRADAGRGPARTHVADSRVSPRAERPVRFRGACVSG